MIVEEVIETKGLEIYEYAIFLMHQQAVLSDSGDPAYVVMTGIYCIASLLKRWILGTNQDSVTPEHLQS